MPAHTMFIHTNGVRLHVKVSGPEDGQLVLLLHGFPEYWGGFAGLIEPLAGAGYRVVVPDQRGYNLSDKPPSTAAYRIGELSRDVTGLIEAFGREKAVLVGHDWGAAVAWHVAIDQPLRVARLAILNVPHPAAMARALTSFTRQVLRSWYIYFFQIPKLPEFLLRLGNYAPMRAMLRSTAKPGAFSDGALHEYTAAWSQPGALTGMIAWYRAAFRSALAGGRQAYKINAGQRVSVPTLILWGEQDVALIPELAQWSLEWCDHGRLVRFPDASHWIQHEKTGQVTEQLLGFLTNSIE